MLTLNVLNIAGTNEIADYRWTALVNNVVIERGEFTGHLRSDGWKKLVEKIVKQPMVSDYGNSENNESDECSSCDLGNNPGCNRCLGS